jgi:hypothetical protein
MEGTMSESKDHDYALWIIVYSIILNVLLLGFFSILFWNTFTRAEWNAGWVAARNNMNVVDVVKENARNNMHEVNAEKEHAR